jgi:aspartate/methionine/tyrosine aminotransferase
LPAANVLSALRDLSSSRDLLVISDEVYADYVYDGAALPDLPDILDFSSLVRIRSFSKLLGMPGERVGFVIANLDRLTAICRAHWTLALSPPATAQAIALSRIGRGAADRVRLQRAVLERNRDLMVAILRKVDRAGVVKPTAGIFLWIGPFGRNVDPVSLEQACRAEAGVAIVSGAAFGLHEPAYLRASFAVPEDEAVRGAKALADFLGPFW